MGVVVGEMECWDLECRWERNVIHLDELEVVGDLEEMFKF